jgi:hypothetical protein
MDTFETLVRMEEDGLWMERQEQESTSQITPEMTEEEKQRLNWESIQFEGNLPSKAFANLRAKEICVTRCAESVPVGNRTRI